jgi:DNA methylase
MKKRKNLPTNLVREDLLQQILDDLDLSDKRSEIRANISTYIDNLIGDLSKKQKNINRIKQNDEIKTKRSAKESLSKKEIQSLPLWVQKEIADSVLIGNSEDVIQTPDGMKYHRKNRLNDLPGGKWTFFLNSVVNTRFPTNGPESFAHEIRKVHPSPKPPQLMRDIIEFFTKENELVLDFFMGVGGTLIGASLSNRRAVGIDLNDEYITAYKKANQLLNLNEQHALVGDSVEILKKPDRLHDVIGNELFSLILIDPPYGDMLSRKKTGEAAKQKINTDPTPFTESKLDLGNMGREEFFSALSEMVSASLGLMKDRGHIVVFMKDLQPTAENPNLLHAETINALNSISGLRYLGLKIWADQGVNLYPYGYPFAFVANQIHQYILIFRKE